MTRFIGKRANFGMGKESTPGTAVAITHWIPAEEKTPNITAEYVSDESDYGVIHNTVSSEVVYSKGEPEVKGLVFDKIIGLFFLGALGTVSTQADTPEAGVNTHTFSVLNSELHPTFTLAFKDPNQDYAFPYSKLQMLTLLYAKKALTRFEAKFVSQPKEADTNTATYATDENHFNSTMATFKLAADKASLGGASVIDIEDMSLKIEKEMIEQESLGNNEPVNIYNGIISVEMEFELLMDNTTYQTLFEAGTVQAAELKLVNTGVTIGAATNPTITIQLNAVNFEEMDFPYTHGDIVRQKFTGKAHYKLADAEAIEAVVINTEASY